MEEAPAPRRPTLRCLGDREPPADLAADLRKLLDLSAEARRQLWSVLGPCLAEPLPSGVEALLDRFCQLHAVAEDTLARAVKVSRFLLREATALGLPWEDFAADLRVLCPDSAEPAEILAPGYEAAIGQVRREILLGSLSDHGKVLSGVDWRIDAMAASNRGPSLRAPVGILTLRYREGDRDRRLTLQALPDTLRELRAVCDRLLATRTP